MKTTSCSISSCILGQPNTFHVLPQPARRCRCEGGDDQLEPRSFKELTRPAQPPLALAAVVRRWDFAHAWRTGFVPVLAWAAGNHHHAEASDGRPDELAGWRGKHAGVQKCEQDPFTIIKLYVWVPHGAAEAHVTRTTGGCLLT